MTGNADRDEIARAVALLVRPGTVMELRSPGSRQGTLSGYFDDHAALVTEAERLSGTVPSVYTTLNPVRPALLARAMNRIEPYAKHTTSDTDVIERRWMLQDFDPIRPAGISSLDSEHDAALAVARATHTWLVDQLGFSADSLILADSGNGAHVLVRCDLPNTPEATALVRRCLEAVALYHGTDTVQVDTTVHNAARISKVYGTLAAKGDSIAERPHRLARVLDAPERVIPASRTLLEHLAALRPADPPPARSLPTPGDDFDVRAWLTRHSLRVMREKPWTNGATVLELEACPIGGHEHHRGEAVVILLASGMLLYKCQHNTCAGREWKDLREHFDGARRLLTHQPDYTPPPPRTGTPPTTEATASPPLATLLDEVESLLARYIVFRSHAQRTAVVLWIAHTHALDAFEVTPYLSVRSAEKRSGKSRLLEVLKLVVPRPWHTVRPSEAVLYRKVSEQHPTLLLDEVDAIFNNKSTDRTEGLRAVLNAGFERGASVDRCTDKGALQTFNAFCAKALGGIGQLPDTIADRSIPIVLARRKATESVSKFRKREIAQDAVRLHNALATWAAPVLTTLHTARPDTPDQLQDRAQDIWEPLLAIADLAGLGWPARAREAAMELSGREPDTESCGVMLLRAIFAVFEDRQVDRISTVDLLAALVEREHEPWPGWWGKDVDQAKDGKPPRKPAMQLARHLKPFGVGPEKHRFGKETAHGYDRGDFEDAFCRYLSPLPTVGRNNGTTVAAQGFGPFLPTSGETPVGTPETLGGQRLFRRSDLDPVTEQGQGAEGWVE